MKLKDIFKRKNVVQDFKGMLYGLDKVQREIAVNALGLGSLSRSDINIVMDSLDKTQIDRTTFTIADWRNALLTAESGQYPDRYSAGSTDRSFGHIEP